MRELDYRHEGKRVMVVPSGKVLATIMDKDILLYCISKLDTRNNPLNLTDYDVSDELGIGFWPDRSDLEPV